MPKLTEKAKRFRQLNRFYDFQGSPTAPRLRTLSEREASGAVVEPLEANVSLTLTQCDRVFSKFGGARHLHAALVAVGRPRTLTSLYYWNYGPEKGGSNGVIPAHAIQDILLAARFEGVVLTAEELDPRPITVTANLFSQIEMGFLPEESRRKLLRMAKKERRAFKKMYRSELKAVRKEERRKYYEQKRKRDEEAKLNQKPLEAEEPVVKVDWDIDV